MNNIIYWWKYEFFISVVYYKIKSRLRIRKANKYNGNDEFHISLNIDVNALLYMNKKRRNIYLTNLYKRREHAHDKEGLYL